MHIRIAGPDDWEKFRKLRLEGMDTDPQAFGGNLTEERNRAESEWRKRFEDPKRFHFVADANGVFVSTAGAKMMDGAIWRVVGVHTLREFRGRGLAKKLLQQVVDEARKRGAQKLELMVNVDQKDALHIYEGAGFRVVRTIKDEMMTDGKLHDLYAMEMSLT